MEQLAQAASSPHAEAAILAAVASVPVLKEYDPDEPRDEQGRWGEGGGGGRDEDVKFERAGIGIYHVTRGERRVGSVTKTPSSLGGSVWVARTTEGTRVGRAETRAAAAILLKEEAVTKALPSEASMNEMSGYYQSLLYAAAKESFDDLEEALPALAKPFFTLSMSSPLVVKYASLMSARLVTEVSTETQAAIRQIVTSAARNGMHPYQQAKLIREVIGLHSRQAASVARYAANLDPGLPTSRADRLIASYADRLLDDRAEMIARTETIRAANMGVRMGGEQLLELPFFTSADLVYVWIVTPDDRLCPTCEALEDQTTDQTGNFQSDDVGTIDAPPAHPNCRCAIGREVTDVDQLQSRIDAFDEAQSVFSPDEEVEKEYDPDQPRDEHGRWGSEGVGSRLMAADPKFELDPESDWRANPDPATRAVAVWQQDYDLNQNVRIAAVNLQAGRDPLEGVSLSERTEGRWGTAVNWASNDGGPREIVLTPNQLKEEVVASAEHMSSLVASAGPSAQEYLRGMRVDDLSAFAPGTTHEVGLTSFTPSAQEANLYTAANDYRQGTVPMVVHLEPGANVADLFGKGIGAMRVSKEGVFQGTLQVKSLEMRGEVAHVTVAQIH